jgi:hypothetical protein
VWTEKGYKNVSTKLKYQSNLNMDFQIGSQHENLCTYYLAFCIYIPLCRPVPVTILILMGSYPLFVSNFNFNFATSRKNI